MARPKLRQADALSQSPTTVPFSLAVEGVVVSRVQLVAALKPFLPQLTDIQPFEDGQRFLFVFTPESTDGSAPASGDP